MGECTCKHLGPDIHDPTNPHCVLFSGAALRLDDGPDEEGLQPPRTIADLPVDRTAGLRREPAVHVQVVSMDGEPPAEPIGWTTTESGRHIPDDEYTVSELDEIHRLPAITIQDTSEDEHRAKAAKLARSNHAFTNFGDPAGLCNVCGAGAGNEIHAAPPVSAQPVRDARMVGVPKRPILADHVFVAVHDQLGCGDRGMAASQHTVPEDFPQPITLGPVHFDRGMSYAWCGLYKADHLTARLAEVTCPSCLVMQSPPPQPIEISPIPALETLNTEITLPQLMVNVDFNELFRIEGEEKTFEILDKLKDLLS